MEVADADIQRCLDTPDAVSPDENTPSRTRFRRGKLVVLAGADGMVLRVAPPRPLTGPARDARASARRPGESGVPVSGSGGRAIDDLIPPVRRT